MHTILGAGGAIGTETAKALKQYTESIRLVNRNPKKVNEKDELVAADLTHADEVAKAVKGSEVVYLTVGLPYSINVWKETWPELMRNTIAACKTSGARLVFFDNIYMYNPEYLGHITESTPVAPVSEKGEVRKQIAHMLMEEVEKGKLTAVIARAADFYGPSIKNASVLTETVFNRLAAGKAANWMMSLKYKHSCTYTPDAGKAVALLGNHPQAFNRVWHLPTAPEPLTGKEWVETIAHELGVKPKVMVASKFMIRMLGLFNPIMKEFVEMLYQYDRDYVFDSSAFEKEFNIRATPYSEGIKEVINKDYKQVGL